MILSAQSIVARCATNPPLVTPLLHQQTFAGLTYGLSPCGCDVRIAEDIRISPGGFVLASTMERFAMPHDLMAVVHDKSTWARQGIAVQNTVIEPGWQGYLTLEITNAGLYKFVRSGTPIAQVVFHLLDQPTDQPYVGKYQNAPAGPSPAIYYEEEKV